MELRDLNDLQFQRGMELAPEFARDFSDDINAATLRAVADHIEEAPDGGAWARGVAHGYRLMAADLEDAI